MKCALSGNVRMRVKFRRVFDARLPGSVTTVSHREQCVTFGDGVIHQTVELQLIAAGSAEFCRLGLECSALTAGDCMAPEGKDRFE